MPAALSHAGILFASVATRKEPGHRAPAASLAPWWISCRSTCCSASATKSGFVTIRSWPVSISQKRPAAFANPMISGSRVTTVALHTTWNCGIAHSASSLPGRSRCSKHAHGCAVSRSAIHATSAGSVTPELDDPGLREQDQLHTIHDRGPSVGR